MYKLLLIIYVKIIKIKKITYVTVVLNTIQAHNRIILLNQEFATLQNDNNANK